MQNLLNKIQQKPILFLLIPFGLILFFIVFLIIFISTSQTSQQKKNATVINGPKKLSTTIEVASTSPAHTATDIGIFFPIRVTFTKPVPASEKNTVTLSLSPTAEGQTSWSSDNKTLTFTPSTPLQSSQQYIATVSTQGNNFAWSFQTVSAENTSPQDQEKAQQQADANYQQWENSVQQKYPWLDKLPLQTDNYFFYFDIDKGSFIGQLYPDPSSNEPMDTQVASMKTEILNQLKALGIPTEQYPIDWQITNENSTGSNSHGE